MFKNIKELVIASHNKGKVKEISELLLPYNISVINGGDFGFDEPIEDGDSFFKNANIKSEYFAKKTGKFCLADDSGLVIPSIGGMPGIYSARWAEGSDGRDFKLAMDKVENALKAKNIKNPSAYFICVLSLSFPNENSLDIKSLSWVGKSHGFIDFPARGENGFGYDPIFIPNDKNQTFAQISTTEKQKLSHRAEAFKLFISDVFDKTIS